MFVIAIWSWLVDLKVNSGGSVRKTIDGRHPLGEKAKATY